MTNEMMYKTAEDRAYAFRRFCESHKDKSSCELRDHALGHSFTPECFAYWLAMNVPDPKPCPFCGANVKKQRCVSGFYYSCSCGYTSKHCLTEEKAIAEHDRISDIVHKPMTLVAD